MTESSQTNKQTDKYCGNCGQKNFRPHRSLKELFSEFVEDWLGFDSKIFKTSKALIQPAALSLDYFANSHHKNHYITPIRLYLLLSVIFFVMTNLAGLNLTEIELDDLEQETVTLADEQETLEAADKTEEITEANQADTDFQFSIGGIDESDFTIKDGCLKNPKDIISLWPAWLDNKADASVSALCQSYSNISYLPSEQQSKAKVELGLSLAQKTIELLPQVFFLSLPILALILGIFYILSKRLYVEHLVLLMHSHSFIFAVILFYLGWYQLAETFSSLNMFPMGLLLNIGVIIYLYLSQKWFYQKGWWATLWRFCLFALLYFMIFIVILLFTGLLGIMVD